MRQSISILVLTLVVGCTAKAITAPIEQIPTPATTTISAPSPNSDTTTLADSFFVTLTSGPPTESCPDVETLVHTDKTDEPRLLALAPEMIKELYTDPGYDEFTDLDVKQAADADVYGEMIKNWCGAKVADSSWVVRITFPKKAPSASLSAGQFMVSKTRKGWQVWFRYH